MEKLLNEDKNSQYSKEDFEKINESFYLNFEILRNLNEKKK